ncbi:DUF4184 family protein [Acidothermaceae bacterium B102]|nr:DUF4184 family protein [Acidothermaceae bacterium B102]
MPFTGSHPAAVLPLLGVGLPASALVIGSTSQDIPYYFPFNTATWPTHSWLGMFTIDPLLGLAAWLVWHGLLSAPALAYAPAGLRGRLTQVDIGLHGRHSVRAFGLAVAALFVGGVTHIFWDEFTHPRRWGTHHIPALTEHFGGLQGYRWSQYGSGLFGASVIAIWLFRWWRRTSPQVVGHQAARWPWLTLVGVAAVAGVVAAVTSPSVQQAAFNGATTGGGTAAALAVVLAAGWHLRHTAVEP